MDNKRRKWSEIELAILYNQVNGICPICQKKLHYEKDAKENKGFQVAHIYPLNPTTKEKEILKNEIKLFEKDPNQLSNVIALCNNCHSYIDNPTTVETYQKLYSIKKNCLKTEKVIELYSSYKIENEIISIIDKLSNGLGEEPEKIEYRLMTIDEKIENSHALLKKKVKYDVAEYYLYIRKLFSEMEKENTGIFDLIAGQIRAFYLNISMYLKDQEEIYEYISKWLYERLNIGSIEACRIVVSFFIQNCEVFKSVAK